MMKADPEAKGGERPREHTLGNSVEVEAQVQQKGQRLGVPVSDERELRPASPTSARLPTVRPQPAASEQGVALSAKRTATSKTALSETPARSSASLVGGWNRSESTDQSEGGKDFE